jgi:hypothetical protein
MSLTSRARKALALTTVVATLGAGIALSPIAAATASASNTSTASAILKAINKVRAKNGDPKLLSNYFLSRYNTEYEAQVVKHKSIYGSYTTKDLPIAGYTTADNKGGPIAAYEVNGTASSRAKGLSKLFASHSSVTDSYYNYAAVAVTAKGNYLYATVTLLQYTSPPAGLLKASKPTISGKTLAVGKTLKAVPHVSPSGGTLTYSWKSAGVEVATTPTYVLAPSDLKHKITLTITGSKSGYVASDESTTTVTATSAASNAVVKGTLTKGKATITGTASVGVNLTANLTGSAPASIVPSYQWYRSGKAIKNAIANNYTVATVDKGKVLTVKITEKAPGYNSASVLSKATKKVTGAQTL